MPAPPGPRRTARLRLEPVAPAHAGDLWRLHRDEAVAAWWGGPWSREDADRYAAAMARAWAEDGVGKWVAYDRETGGLLAGLAHGLRSGDLGGQLPRVLGAALVQLPAVWVMAGVAAALFGLPRGWSSASPGRSWPRCCS